ncbi:porin [Bradyrhizobium quebecense]|uniref:Porin n=1 Tax=Bradyrhizobium quebecense TaxID=2748629 RepID=A0ACD3VJI0_9BRAD|nr:porin [Bradyrhizobium quebecense]UGY06135.1 porin [Bradyrhizobium quebecense]
MLTSSPAKATDDVGELKAEIRALSKRLTELEEQKRKVKKLDDRVQKVERAQEAHAEAPASGPTPAKAGPWESFKTGRPVHIFETDNTDVLLYGVIEPTLGYTTNVDAAGRTTFGLNTSWFSGNRWGIYVTQKMFPEYGFNLLARMESEFELPSGNMDTPGVLFNRDAWVGFESPLLGKFSVGRQNTLPRDVANIWGDPYGSSSLSTNEGGFTNVNNFKQLIFYTSGGNGAGGRATPATTRAWSGRSCSTTGCISAQPTISATATALAARSAAVRSPAQASIRAARKRWLRATITASSTFRPSTRAPTCWRFRPSVPPMSDTSISPGAPAATGMAVCFA